MRIPNLAAHTQRPKNDSSLTTIFLVVKTSTELELHGGTPARIPGVLNVDYQIRVYDRTHLALTREHLCLGLSSSELFARDPNALASLSKTLKSSDRRA